MHTYTCTYGESMHIRISKRERIRVTAQIHARITIISIDVSSLSEVQIYGKTVINRGNMCIPLSRLL